MKEKIIKIIKKQNEQLKVINNLITALETEYKKLESTGDEILLLNIESDIRMNKTKKQAIELNIELLKAVLV